MKQERKKEVIKAREKVIKHFWKNRQEYQIRTMEETGFIFNLTAVRIFQIINK